MMLETTRKKGLIAVNGILICVQKFQTESDKNKVPKFIFPKCKISKVVPDGPKGLTLWKGKISCNNQYH